MSYYAKAVSFRGDSLLYRTNVIGSSSPKLMTSCWFNCHGPGVSGRTKLTVFQANAAAWDTKPGGSTLYIDGGAVRKWFVYPRDSDGSNGSLQFAADNTGQDRWHHVLCSIDCSSTISIQLYVDDVAVSLSESFTDGAAPFDIDVFLQTFIINDWKVTSSTQPAIQDMADVWIASGVALDLSVIANRRLFRSVSGKPVFLGDYGQIPTGSRPTMFFSGGVGEFAVNRGTGGDFARVGPLMDAYSSPSQGVLAGWDHYRYVPQVTDEEKVARDEAWIDRAIAGIPPSPHT